MSDLGNRCAAIALFVTLVSTVSVASAAPASPTPVAPQSGRGSAVSELQSAAEGFARQVGLPQKQTPGGALLASRALAPAEMSSLLASYDRLRAADQLVRQRYAAVAARIASKRLSGAAAARQAAAAAAYRSAADAVLQPLAAPFAALRKALEPAPREGKSAASAGAASLDLAALERALDAVRPALEAATRQAPHPILRASSLPYRRGGLAPRSPVATPTLQPSYLDPTANGSLSADLAGAPEAPENDEILARAAALQHDYVAIYEFVRNQIRTEWYAGSMKGAIGTLRQGGGNDVDQASLLLALLRASGAPARYVRGVVELPVDLLEESLGVGSASAVGTALARAGVANAPVVRGGQVAAYQVEHTWVSAYLPYTNYRGAVVDFSGKSWVPLAPAIKRLDVVPPTGVLRQMGYSIDAAIHATLAAPQTADPLTALRGDVTTYLSRQASGGTYAAQLGYRAVHPLALGLLPSSMPVAVVAITGESPRIDPAAVHQIRVVARSGDDASAPVALDATLPIASVASARLTLSYLPATVDDQRTVDSFGGLELVPAYLVKLRPQLKLDGVQVAVGEGEVDMAASERVEITLSGPFGSDTIEETVVAGSYYAVGVAAQRTVPPPSVTTPTVVTTDPSDTESRAAALLSQEALALCDRWDQGETELGGLLDVSFVHPEPSLSVAGNAVAVEELFSQPYALHWEGVTLDAALRVAEPFSRTGDARAPIDWMRLSALQGSALEHLVFEKDLAVDSISADKGLGVAHQGGVPVVALDSTNVDALLPTLGQPAEVQADLRNWIRQGYTAEVPQGAITRAAWRGAVWRVEDPASGAAGYFLSGGLAGGATAETPDNWVLGFLRDALLAPYGSEPDGDPQSAASITKLVITDGQMGTVDSVLPVPLGVLVRDASGRPVKSATVTFTPGPGGSKMIGVDLQPHDSLVVQTDGFGRAFAGLQLGKHVADSPVYLNRTAGDLNPTEALLQLVDVTVDSASGPLSPDAAFQAIGFPGPPAALVRVGGSGTELGGDVSFYAGDLWLLVDDAFGNSVSNVPVTYSVGSPTPRSDAHCTNPGSNPQNAAVFDATSNGDGKHAGCPLVHPVLGDCGGPSVTITSSAFGTLAGVLLGNDVTFTYTVNATAAGLSPLHFTYFPNLLVSQAGAPGFPPLPDEMAECTPGNGSVHHAVSHVNLKGERVDATRAGHTYPVPVEVVLFAWIADYQIRWHDDPHFPYFRFLPTGSWEKATGDLSFTVNNGGSASATVYDPAVQSYSSQITTGALPGLNDVTGVTTHITYIADTLHPDGTVTKEPNDLPTTGIGVVTSLWGVEPKISGIDPNPILLSTAGRTSRDTTLAYTVLPAAYDSLTTDVDFLVAGEPSASAIGSTTTGAGQVVVPRGFAFDIQKTYQAGVVLNRGDVQEVKSDLFTLPLSEGVFSRVDTSVHLSEDVDLLNQRYCAQAGAFTYSQAQKATVSLFVAPVNALNTDGSPSLGAEQALFRDQDLEAGDHSYLITPSGSAPADYQLAPGTYQFRLHGVADVNGATEDVTGILVSEYQTHDTLAVGHVLVKGVDLFEGHLSVGREDFAFAGRGVPLEFNRTYASNAGDRPGALGPGWSHSYESKVIVTACGDAIVLGGEGSGMRFVGDGHGGLMPLKGYHGSLVANTADGSFDFYAKSGTRYHFKHGLGTEWPLDSITDTHGNATRLDYDTSDPLGPRLAAVHDAAGRTLSFHYERRNFALWQGWVLTKIDGPEGTSATYDYDLQGNLAHAVLDGGARAETYTYAAPPAYGLELRHKLLAVHNDLDGATTSYVYKLAPVGLQGNIQVPSYSVSQVTEPEGGVTGFTFDAASLASGGGPLHATVTDPRGKDTRYTLNSWGSPLAIEDPLGNKTSMTWSSTDIVMTARTDANGVTTSYTYDAYANPTAETVTFADAQGTSHTYTIVTTYWDPAIFIPPYIKERVKTRTDRNGATTSNTYDSQGNLTRQEMTVTAIDASQRTEAVVHTYLDNGDRASTTDERGNPTLYTYDVYGNLASHKDALGETYSTAWNERSLPITQTDALGRVTKLDYDLLGRLTTRTFPSTGGVTAAETTTYDDAHDQVTQTDAEGRSTITASDRQGRTVRITNGVGAMKVFAYDLASNKIQESDWFDGGSPEHDTTFDYDDASRLLRRTEPLGRVTSYGYDAVGNVLSEKMEDTLSGAPARLTQHAYDGLDRRVRTDQTLESGLATTLFTLDGNGNTVQEVDPLGRVTAFRYDERNRKLEERGPDYAPSSPSVVQNTYDPTGNLVQEKRFNAPQARLHQMAYDAANRPVKRTNSLGQVTNLEYDANGNLTRQIDPLLNVTTFAYDERNRLATTSVQLNRVTQPIRTVTTTYGYDRVGNRVSELLPNGNAVVHTYDGVNRLTATRDSLGSMAAITYDANGQRLTETDANGNVVQSHYDAQHRLIGQDLPEARTVAFTYDAFGNRLTATDPRGLLTTYAYDLLNRVVLMTDPAPLAGTATSRGYTYDLVGNRTSETDRNGHTTTYAYDGLNRQILATDPAPLGFTRSWTYDGLGNKTTEHDRRGTLSEFSYDSEGRLTQMRKAGLTLEQITYDAVGNKRFEADANGNVTGYEYDERNLLLAEDRPLAAITHYVLDDMGDRLTATDPEGRVTTFSHDVRRRLLTETDNAGDMTTYVYDGNGNRTSHQRPAFPGAWTYHYDGANRLTEVDDPLAHATTYAYDKDSNRTAETDAEHQTTRWEFDVLNRPTAKIYPDAAREEHTYDGNGNRIALKDANGQTITYSYDENNRETARAYPPPTPATADDLVSIGTTYDPNGNPLTVTETYTGTPTSRTTVHTYDAFDRMESVTDRFGLTLAYTYDANGNRTTLTDPAGALTRYTYDGLNRLTAVATGTGVATYDYYLDSRRKKVSYPNASFETVTYDAAARVQSVENRQSATAVVSRFDYLYDRNGNRTQQIETRGTPAVAETTTYSYDAADRLTEVVYPEKHTIYTLDGVGDRLTERATATAGGAVTDLTSTHNNRHQLTAIVDGLNAANNVSYTYDANGNQLTRTVGGTGGITTAFTFDVRDELSTVRQGTSLLGAYSYDSRGLRVVKQGSLGYVHYTYDDHSVLYETDVLGAPLAKFDYGSDRLLSLTPGSGGRQFYLFDGLGSVTDLTNLDGSLRATYQYDAWGNPRSTSGQSFNLFGFTGHERDPETGLYYFKHRFYDPATGRFLTEDPMEGQPDTPPSLQRYLYAYGNPLVYGDPDGRETAVVTTSENTDGQKLYVELVKSGMDPKEAEVHVDRAGLAADIGLSRSRELVNFGYLADAGELTVKYGLTYWLLFASAPLEGASLGSTALSVGVRRAVLGGLSGAAAQGVPDLVDEKLSSGRKYATAATVGAVTGVLTGAAFDFTGGFVEGLTTNPPAAVVKSVLTAEGEAGLVGVAQTTKSAPAEVSSAKRVVIDMFGGQKSQLPGAVNVDVTAVQGVRASATALPFNAGSVDEIVASNPYIHGGRGMQDFLPEAARVLKRGGKIVINATKRNPFGMLPSQDALESMGLRVLQENGPLPRQFENSVFRFTDGKTIPNGSVRTTVLEKVLK